MQIDLDTIDRTRFRVREYNDGNHALITRAHGLNYDYRPGEHELRSVVVETATGKVVSSGFPKFFNYGEDAETDRAFREASAIWYTPKHDGSLIIVSPQEDGSAIVRTRGQYDLGDFEDRVMPLVRPEMEHIRAYGEANSSYLFEYVGPENRIVLPYREPDLRYLGFIQHDDMGFRQRGPVRVCEDLDTLVSGISESSMDEAGEGVVAHCIGSDGKVWMCKVKTKEYLVAHRLRFAMTDKKLRALTAYKGFGDLAVTREYIEQKIGLDFECVDADVVLETIERAEFARRVRQAFAGYCEQHDIRDRRGIAIAAKGSNPDLSQYLMHSEFHTNGWEVSRDKAEKALVSYGAGMSYRQVEALVSDLTP